MRAARPGAMEYTIEAAFLYHCYSQGGCRSPMFTSIAASGTNAATLHYGHAGAPNGGGLCPAVLCFAVLCFLLRCFLLSC